MFCRTDLMFCYIFFLNSSEAKTSERSWAASWFHLGTFRPQPRFWTSRARLKNNQEWVSLPFFWTGVIFWPKGSIQNKILWFLEICIKQFWINNFTVHWSNVYHNSKKYQFIIKTIKSFMSLPLFFTIFSLYSHYIITILSLYYHYNYIIMKNHEQLHIYYIYYYSLFLTCCTHY